MWGDEEVLERVERLRVLSEQAWTQRAEVLCQIQEWDRVRLELNWRREHRRAQKLVVSPNQRY